jgi:ABC-type sulfate/molybdate transport systems ATPase subunit
MSWRVAVAARLGAFELDVEVAGDDTPTAIVGPNGAGKTTLLRLIAGAYRPHHGSIVVGQRVLFDSDREIDRPIEDRKLGYVPQGYGLFPHLRVIDNVAFGLSRSGAKGSRALRRRAASEVLDALGCTDLGDRFPSQLSGGEQQRVALARALVTDPDLLLLDEPLAAIDAGARRSLRGVLAARLRSRGRPTIVVTHDIRDVIALGANVYALERGRIVQHGTVAELRAAAATDFVAEFCGADLLDPVGSLELEP